MGQSDITTSDGSGEGLKKRLEWWVLFKGDRLTITVGAVVAVFVLTIVFVRLDVISVGPKSYIPTVFGGMIAGLLTLVTVTLTINQLILSQIFGTPRELSDNLEGTRQFRKTIEDLSDRHSAPTEPADFISLIGETLYDRTTSLQENVDGAGTDDEDISEQLSNVVTEADTLRNIDADQMRSIEILEIFIGSKYARNISTVDRIQDAYADYLSADAKTDLDAVMDLLEAVAIVRQHFKTLLLHQTLAQLSRYITYFGVCAIVVALLVPLVYRSDASSMIVPQYLPWVASTGIAIGVAPLMVFLAYILRIATVSKFTLSVGPFVPPAEKKREE